MSILSALVRAYERMPDAPVPGYSVEKIGWAIALEDDGSVAHVIDLRTGDGKKKQPRALPVPQPPKRASGIAPVFLWDKTAYVLGVTAGEDKRTAREHAAFVDRHREWLAGSDDEGLRALLAFLESWTPEQFQPPLWPEEMKDQNVVFALEKERLRDRYLHDREAARAIWTGLGAAGDKPPAVCLVTGKSGSVARLHPAIKGVWGGQSAGGSIVSFNRDAFESYGHEQGDNAPVSDYAAFAYTTALNTFLKQGSRNRIQVGDASTVFWAEAPEPDPEAEAEAAALFGDMFAGETAADTEAIEAAKVGALVARMVAGEPLAAVAPRLARGVRFHVLGLAPNAARISIRFHLSDDFGVIARRYLAFVAEMAVEPPPRVGRPALWRTLAETAVLGKRENVPPNLAGECLRAILAGTPYPLTLLATVLMRIRADGDINALRVGMLKAVLIRNFGRKETPVALDRSFTDRGYLLGRLFAVYEFVQRTALGAKVNATVKDKFYGAASAQPQKVFGILANGAANHFSKIGKDSMGRRVQLERQLGEIMDLMEPGANPIPPHLSAEEQAMFALGYHHQYSEFFRKKDSPDAAAPVETA